VTRRQAAIVLPGEAGRAAAEDLGAFGHDDRGGGSGSRVGRDGDLTASVRFP
jgi:hypothetical protein